jgi:hypothetical protein
VARKKASANGSGGETIAGYFRRVFKENPKWLRGRSNEAVLQRWKDDHPGEELTNSVKIGLSNIKSVLRSKKRKRKARKEVSAEAGAAAAVARATQARPRLGALEEAIDGCLSMARAGGEGLGPVADPLHRARNLVVWQMGEPR